MLATLRRLSAKDIAALALSKLDLSAGRVLVVGDNLDIDICLGKVAGCRTTLTLEEVTSVDDVRRASTRQRSDTIVSDLTVLLTALQDTDESVRS